MPPQDSNVATIDPSKARVTTNQHHLNRDQMVRVIRQGGSVLFRGEIITQEHALPSEVDIALEGDSQAQEFARDRIRSEIDELRAKLALLEAGQTPTQANAGDGQAPPQTAPQSAPAPAPAQAQSAPEDPKAAQRAAVLGDPAAQQAPPPPPADAGKGNGNGKPAN